MNKYFISVVLFIFMGLFLISCGSINHMEPSDSRTSTGNEGGIVGTGNTNDCEKKSNRSNSKCSN